MGEIICSLVTLIVIIFFISLLRYFVKKKIMLLIQKQDIEELLMEIDKNITKMLVPAYSREGIRLSAYLMQNDSQKIEEQFRKMWEVPAKPLQRQDFLVKMFNYYIFLPNQEKSKMMLEAIKKEIRCKETVQQAQMLYNIFFKNSYAYINELEKNMEFYTKEQKAMAYYYISMQYKNMNNMEKANEYKEKSKKCI